MVPDFQLIFNIGIFSEGILNFRNRKIPAAINIILEQIAFVFRKYIRDPLATGRELTVSRF